MSPREVYNELLNLKNGSLSSAVSSENEYSRITIYVSLLVHKNPQYSKVYLGDKLLGTLNKYRYQKLSDDLELKSAGESDNDTEATNLFASMLSTYLTKIKVTDTVIKTLIIFLVYNKKIAEFRNVRKLSESEWGIKTIEYLENLGINSKVLMDSFSAQFDEYPKHKEVIMNRIHELMFTNNCRERYNVLMKPVWNAGELSFNDPIEQDLINAVLDLRSKVRLMCSNIQEKDLESLLGIPHSTYGNKKRELVKGISKYFYNSIYSNLIDLITSLE